MELWNYALNWILCTERKPPILISGKNYYFISLIIESSCVI